MTNKELRNNPLPSGVEPSPITVEWSEDKVKALEESALLYSVGERNALVERLTEDFFERFGFPMPGMMLNRLADVIMADELRSQKKNKAADEYSFLSPVQVARRKFGVHSSSLLQGREVSFSAALTVGTNGRNYALPVRSFHNPD